MRVHRARKPDNAISNSVAQLSGKLLPDPPIEEPPTKSSSKLLRFREKRKQNPQVRFSLPVNTLLDNAEKSPSKSNEIFNTTDSVETEDNGSKMKRISQHQKNSSSVYSIPSYMKAKRRNSMFPFETTSQNLAEDPFDAFVKPQDHSHFKISVPLVIRTPPKLSKVSRPGDYKLDKELVFNGDSYEMIDDIDEATLSDAANRFGVSLSTPSSPLKQSPVTRESGHKKAPSMTIQRIPYHEFQQSPTKNHNARNVPLKSALKPSRNLQFEAPEFSKPLPATENPYGSTTPKGAIREKPHANSPPKRDENQYIRSNYHYPPLNHSQQSSQPQENTKQNNTRMELQDYYEQTMPSVSMASQQKRLSQSPRKHNHTRSKSQINILSEFDNLNINGHTSPRKLMHSKAKSQSGPLIYSQTKSVNEIIIPELTDTPLSPMELQRVNAKLDFYLNDQVARNSVVEHRLTNQASQYNTKQKSPRRVASPMNSHSSYESTFSLAKSNSTRATSVHDSENVMIDLTHDNEEVVITRNKLKGSITSYRSIRQKTKQGKTIEVVLVDDDDGESDTIDQYANDFKVHDSIKRQNSAASTNDELTRLYSLYGKLKSNGRAPVKLLLPDAKPTKKPSLSKRHSMQYLTTPKEQFPLSNRHSSFESDASASSYFVGDEKHMILGNTSEWKTKSPQHYLTPVQDNSSPYVLAPGKSARKPKEKKKDVQKTIVVQSPSSPPKNNGPPIFTPSAKLLSSIDHIYDDMKKAKNQEARFIA